MLVAVVALAAVVVLAAEDGVMDMEPGVPGVGPEVRAILVSSA